ncbi:MAG: hypothetical protein JSS20_08575, partial [Proteobacteria bacterium]|nr:hypothetical protein [Pseudomonadota bacterium]
DRILLTPYIGAGTHDWKRSVNAGEEYSHNYVGSGLLAQWSPLKRVVVSADALVGRTFGSSIDVASDLSIPGFSASLGNSLYFRSAVGGDVAVSDHLHLRAGIEYVRYNYGASAIQPSGYYEPDSRTGNWMFGVGMGYAFAVPQN